ncbi:MAG: hypothetical protein M1823_004753 [Watsoniomyces obsoletus]|nr:MAG: hypothetical protein M1823_004753 [Watsoniomyces obsoletus]
MSLLPEQEARYTAIIDGILEKSNLNTVSEKRIRKGLEEAVQDDLSSQKPLIKSLIYARFDHFSEKYGAGGQGNLNSLPCTNSVSKPEPTPPSTPPTMTNGHGSTTPLHDSDEASTPMKEPPTKKRRTEGGVIGGGTADDAKLAAMLQAEENSRARPTRGTTTGTRTRKTAPANNKKGGKKLAVKPKKNAVKPKSPTKVKDDEDGPGGDDSDEATTTTKRKVNRSGGFHKPLTLSAPLAAIVGATTLSRPETVKRIWDHVKANDLQDPQDKRQIRCDDALKCVFKQDRIHMFTMNKVLSKHFFTPE